jgi:transcriptional regulator with XRE-family HTH domain
MDGEVLKSNLRGLLAIRGLSQKDLADLIGGETAGERHTYYRWLRRTCSQGLTRCEGRNREQLQRLCEFFGVEPVERLWNRGLLESQEAADEYADMLRFIIQATTAESNHSYYDVDGVDTIALMRQVRQAYEIVVKQSGNLARTVRWGQRQEQRQRLEVKGRERELLADALLRRITSNTHPNARLLLKDLGGPTKAKEVILSILGRRKLPSETLIDEDQLWEEIRPELFETGVARRTTP